MSLFSRIRSLLSRGRPKPLNDWFFVTFDDRAVHIRAEPSGKPAWSQDFAWDTVLRVCFKAEDLFVSDGIYVFTNQRPESYLIPTEARGGAELWSEILRRKLFDATLAIEAASSPGGLYCWPADEIGTQPITALNRSDPSVLIESTPVDATPASNPRPTMRHHLSRIRKPLLALTAAASLLLCLTTLVLWPVGYWRRHVIAHQSGLTQIGFVSENGTLGLNRYIYPSAPPGGWFMRSIPADPKDANEPFAPFDFGHLRIRKSNLHYDAVWCPNWFPAALFGTLPTLWLVKYRRHRTRSQQGRCHRCGYDLRATPTRCPECGTQPPADTQK